MVTITIPTPLIPFVDAAAILLVTWLLAWLTRTSLRRLMKWSQPIVATQAGRIGWAIVWLVGGILAIEQLDVRSDILLLVFGLIGVAAILGTRLPLENLAAKYFSDVYLPFKVGDSIQIRGHSGRVIEFNAMATVMLADDDTLHAVPNSVFLTEPVVNLTPQAWKEVIVPIVINSDVDLAEFESAVLKSCNKLKLRLDPRLPAFLATRTRGPQTTELTLTLMVRRPGDRDAVATEVHRRVAEVIAALPGRRR